MCVRYVKLWSWKLSESSGLEKGLHILTPVTTLGAHNLCYKIISPCWSSSYHDPNDKTLTPVNLSLMFYLLVDHRMSELESNL